MSRIITFYSYKGGVGRTMSMANAGVVLSQWGYKVLLIDWDLEAPGLELFFKPYLSDIEAVQKSQGLLEVLLSFGNNSDESVSWQDVLVPVSTDTDATPLHLLTAGRQDEHYVEKLRSFNVQNFYSQNKGGKHIERFRNELLEHYDFVLIDSRTGITDFGGLCTIQFPDILVLLFTPTEQGLAGIKSVAEKAVAAQMDLPYDREKLLTVPIPTRIDTSTEYQITQEWITRIADQLSPLMADWIPKAISARDIIETSRIPYITFFSYGEQLPVLEQGTKDRSGLGYAYENLASLLANNLEHVELFLEDRFEFINRARTREESHSSELIIKVFMSYSHKDSDYAHQLTSYLSVLSSTHNVRLWNDSNINVGEQWERKIYNEIQDSDIFLFLVSKDTLSSKWAMQEFGLIQGMKADHPIIPILLEPTSFEESPLSRYRALPGSGKPISEYKDRDRAYTDITVGVRKVVDSYLNEQMSVNKQAFSIINNSTEINTLSSAKAQAKAKAENSALIRDIHTNLVLLKEDIEVEYPMLRKNVDDDQIKIAIARLDNAEKALAELDADPQNRISKGRIMRFINELSDEDSTVYTTLKSLRSGRDHAENLATKYNQVATNLSLPEISPSGLERIQKL